MSSQPRAAAVADRRLLILLALAAAVTLAIGALYIRSLTPHMSASEAGATAIAHLQQQVGGSGWVVLTTRYQGSPDRIYDDHGNLIGSESGVSCFVLGVPAPEFVCPSRAVWIVHLSAPRAGGHADDAYVVISDATGRVSSSNVATR